MAEDLSFADLTVSSDMWCLRLRVVLNAEIIGKPERGFPRGNTEKAAGEVDHITIRLTAEAVKALVHLHAGVPVIMKRAFAHTPVSHPQPVALGGLSGCDIVLDSIKQIHTTSRKA